ncbi:MAG: site-2 protease family protein [Planctomycetia bacterium]|nr:site-2 protease family protein [Planctomycetia bacterium]
MNGDFLLVILEVAVGLGMLIFVHELGHFAVAKWCGVKCEKFYLGFDIYGLKLAKFQWGETEYGIGILPLGGYVKMLGQDDNPARAAEERERSRLQPGAPEVSPNQPTEPITETAALDPRSYMAKSVPQRMAIISAGVIMNLIFAVVLAAVAYGLGVRDAACGISAVLPGQAAWKANLQPGDMFVQIDHSGDRQLQFHDLMLAVALGNMEKGIDLQIKREGVTEPFWVNLKPDPDKNPLRPTIGVAGPATTKLAPKNPVVEGTPAAKANAFHGDDRIVAVGGVSIHTYAELQKELARHSGEPLRFTVEREKEDATPGAPEATSQLDIDLPPRPMHRLGLVMNMGKITAVQADSPAIKAGLQADDFIVSIDGQSSLDPMRLPDELRRRAGETITVAISRQGPSGQDETLEKLVTLRDPAWPEESLTPGSPVSVPAMGITYKVLNIVHQTEKGSPAAVAQLMQGDKPAAAPLFASGDEIVKAEFLAPKHDKPQADSAAMALVPDPVEFSGEKPNWPFFMTLLQMVPAGTQVKLTLKDGRAATLAAEDADLWFYPNRGLVMSPEITMTKAHSLAEAMALGAQQTKEKVLEVYAFLRKLGTQISPYGLVGPKTIVEAACSAASEGVPELLMFLTMLSANLAVINFLPIPVLDGGHMVFLILEGILRRPVNERVLAPFMYLGLLFIVLLMLFVLGLDFGLIPRVH